MPLSIRRAAYLRCNRSGGGAVSITERPHNQAGCGRVVVGVHGSKSSRLAFGYAVGIARERGWDLEIVTAWPDADEVMIHDVPGRYIVSRGRALESQKDALGSLDPALAERASTFLANARPEQALVTRCTDADLLVVGAGRPDRERDRLGVGAECAKEALCPVTVIPAPDHIATAPVVLGVDGTSARAGALR